MKTKYFLYYFNNINLKIQYNNFDILSIKYTEMNVKTNILATNEFERKISQQLNEYFGGTRKFFTLPYQLNGTDFQKKVWLETLKIAYSETKSYKEIAYAIGNPKSYRAVGQALKKNKLLLIIPCHRVIGTNKQLIGFNSGKNLKLQLIELEKKYEI